MNNLISFIQYLKEDEEPKGKVLKHLTHLEDLPIHQGHEGVSTAADFLDNVHKKLLGQKAASTHVSTKYDGSPSVVFGHHPKTGKFFVASKSAFNKDPKINYTPEDIEKNHGHAPGLVAKLKASLEHLPKIMPARGGIYQGDLMHTREDIKKKNGQTSFTPNTITYSTPSDSAHGKAIENSQMGIVVHTKYRGKGELHHMSAGPVEAADRAQFRAHPDVHNIDPTANVNPDNYTPDEQAKFLEHREKATKAYAGMKPEALDALKGHEVNLEAHINDMVRQGTAPSADGYIKHLAKRSAKELEKVKSPAAKEKKSQAAAAAMQHVYDNRDHFDKALKLHHHLQNAKNVLTGVMAKNAEFGHSIGDEPTGPEGAVAVNKKGDMAKFVDRGEFSRQNFLMGKMMQAKKAQENA